MGIPREIRDAIFEICLVVEGPINPHPAYYESKDPFAEADRKPDVALLKVNKFLIHEATKILYSKNVWRLTWPGGDPQNFQRIVECRQGQIWGIHSQHIRHVITSFDVRDVEPDELLNASRTVHEPGYSDLDMVAKHRLIHDHRFQSLRLICQWKYLFFKLLSPSSATVCGFSPPESATFDLDNFFCPSGCCREEALGAICREIVFQRDYRNCMLKGHQLEQCETDPQTKYTILGLKTTAERNIVRRAWHRKLEDEDSEKVSGGTELSIWW